MNKFLRQNWRIFNKISFRPIGLDEPEGLNDINQWAENVWNHLCDDELKRIAHYVRKGKKGYTITLLLDDKFVYLVQVVRSEYNTDETVVYTAINTDDNINDFKAIAKFIHKNINDFINTSKNNVKQFNELAAQQQAREIEEERAGKA